MLVHAVKCVWFFPDHRRHRSHDLHRGTAMTAILPLRSGWKKVTGIELSSEYAEIAAARIRHWAQCE
jgi:hypothetical protein